jgi:hypothetical protein
MKRRRLLLCVGGILVAAVGAAVWIYWPNREKGPSTDAIIGNWVREDADKSDLTLTFYRSGDFDMAVALGKGDDRPEPLTAHGSWELKGKTLTLSIGTVDSNAHLMQTAVLEIRVSGDRLAYVKGGVSNTLHRAPPQSGQSFDSPMPASFDGASDGLAETVIVPTLETTIPPGKSAIWCAALALAWQRLEKHEEESLIVEGAEEIARALGQLPDVGLMPEHYYAEAGLVIDGVGDRMRQEMSTRFPKAPLPKIDNDPDTVVAFAFLEPSIRYQFEFRDDPKPLQFKDCKGRVTPVRAFGIRKMDEDQGKDTFRGQVRVLFHDSEDFALDLSGNTHPYQIVVARTTRKASLHATLADIEKRTAAPPSKDFKPDLGDGAVLLIPNMHWRIAHHFAELEGKWTRKRGSIIKQAQQIIQFKLDRRGAKLTAQALAADWLDGHRPEDYSLDVPYLILMRRRGVQQPFFVMWVDNAELMIPRK